MSVFGYISRPAPDAGADDSAAEAEILQNYCDCHNLFLQAIFIDAEQSTHIPWLTRPAGLLLAEYLEPGDQVIVPHAGAIYSKPSDLLSLVQDFQERGIVLHFANFQEPGNELESLSTDGGMGEALVIALRALASLSKGSRSEAVSAGMQEKKLHGGKYCRDAAGYGFTWRHGKREPHPQEQAVIAKIVEWRGEGFSWGEIARRLLRQRVLTKDGCEWSPSRVRRAYLADLQRRAVVGIS